MSRLEVPFALPDITEAEVEAVARAVRSGWVTSGPEMVAFEEEFAEYVGGEVEAVALNSATAGLHLALEACGIGPGDEVIVPTWTFTATAEVVRYVGAKPVLVDVEADTLNISLQRVAEALTPRTKAVLPVHFAGLGVDIRLLREVVGPDVRIIEDAAHALPTVTGGVMVGECRHSDAAVFSFYATKTITTGEGGMLTTRDPEIAGRARIMRLHGIDRDAFDRYRSAAPSWFYDVIAAGFKYNLTDPAAAMGRVQLARSPNLHARRVSIAERYLVEFADLSLGLPAQVPFGDTQSWHLFVLRIEPEAGIDRDGFVAAMSERGIGTSVHFIPLHLHTIWRTSLPSASTVLANASSQFEGAVSIPLFSAMTDTQVDQVVAAVSGVLGVIKRLFDLVASAVGLILLAPAMVVIATLVKRDSPGPALYRQERIGRDGKPFTLLKFRSMTVAAADDGPSVTAATDARITRVGARLRSTKLDELPQLINVLRGDMSIVGPRPEVARYVAMWPEDDRSAILSVRPGITDPVSIQLRREEDLLAQQPDPEFYYSTILLPMKVSKYSDYVRSQGNLSDMRIAFMTLLRVVRG